MTDYADMERGAELMRAMAFHALHGAIIEVSSPEQIETGGRIFNAYRQAIANLDVKTIIAYERLADERENGTDRHARMDETETEKGTGAVMEWDIFGWTFLAMIAVAYGLFWRQSK